MWKPIYQHCTRCMLHHGAFIRKNGIIFIWAFLMFLFNQFALKKWLPTGFVHSHLNDLLVMGVFLPYCNILLSFYDRRDVRLMRLPMLLLFTLVVGVFWEFVAPLYAGGTSDMYDLVAYLLGTVVYYIWIREH